MTYLPHLIYSAIFAVSFVVLLVTVFALYVSIMKMREIKETIYTLHWPVRWACYSIVFVGVILNTALNWIFLTVAFVELPHEFLSTDRVIRHLRHSTGWRQKRAKYFCDNWLSPFDPSHCGE